MNFEDLKEQLREQFSTLWNRIQESSAWIQLSEKFNDLTPGAQKALLASASALLALMLLAFPWMFYSSSQTLVTEFEDNRRMIRELYRVSRATKTMPSPPAAPGDLQNLVNGHLRSPELGLQPEQIRSVSPLDAQSVPGIPKALEKDGLTVSLGKLNLRQVVDVGHGLQTLHPSLKMTGLTVKASPEDHHYFDVEYQIVAVSLPPEPAPKAPPGRGNRRVGNGS